MIPLRNDPNEKTQLEIILAQGFPAFQTWIRIQARKAELIIFQEGHLAANPLARYITAQLGDATNQAHLYERMIYTAFGAQALPEVFQDFLWRFHDAFAAQPVTAGALAEWLAQSMPLPYLHDDLTDHYHRLHEGICQALEQAIALVRQCCFRDPNQPTAEECLGIALAKYCSWEGARIARTCLRLCDAALEDANYATLARLLREHFGEETFR